MSKRTTKIEDVTNADVTEIEFGEQESGESAKETSLKKQTDDELAERRAELRIETSVLKRKGEALAAERDDIDAEFKRRFRERDITGTRCQMYTISLRQVDNYPQIVDRAELEEFILASGKLHLLQNRVAQKAMQEELALMKEEAEALKLRLEEAGDDDLNDTALEALGWIEDVGCPKDPEVLRSKLNVIMQTTNNLRKTVCKMLDDSLVIPGVQMVTKESINQIKRG